MSEELDETESTEELTDKGPKPTLSNLLLTPEEKRARTVYRLNASKCCVQEAWRMYRRVTNSDLAIEPANLSSEPSGTVLTRMGVLYDPTAGLRMRFLQRKFAHLLHGFMALKQAAYRPFIRCQRPKRIDVDGQGKAMPAIAKTFHREVYLTYVHPSTFAYKEQWDKIFNSNFLTKEDMLRDLEDNETQTELNVEKFDLEDIPLDNEGNPIGRSVGICEWCGKSILPIPSEHALSVEWNIEALYCCKKYRLYIEEVKKETLALEAEHAKKHFLIDISPGKRRGKYKVEISQEEKEKRAKIVSGNLLKILQEKYNEAAAAEPEEERQKDKDASVDTFDLPWDPAETRFREQMRAKQQQDSQGGKTGIKDVNILLELEEVYSNSTRDSMPVPQIQNVE